MLTLEPYSPIVALLIRYKFFITLDYYITYTENSNTKPQSVTFTNQQQNSKEDMQFCSASRGRTAADEDNIMTAIRTRLEVFR